jgi:hypothetical protein
MPRAKQSRGACAYCGAQIAKSGMTRHLSACPQRRAAIDEAERSKAKAETLYHLRVQDAYQPEFWLDLEVRGSATLNDLDSYLRHIWLECCGHLSEFSLGGWGSRKVAKSRKIGEVFGQGGELTHIYDFGTSSETRIRAVEARVGKPTTAHPIALMARNLMPEADCIECGRPAASLCLECLNEDERGGTLCEEHTRLHPHEDYGEPIPLVNSPRLGMCGYTGPAEPPY